MVDSSLLNGILDYATFAMLLLAVAHFVSRQLEEDLPKLLCYVIGTALISLVFGVWCVRLTEPITGNLAFIAYAAIVAGAGAGTLLGWGVDWIGERIGEHRALRREVRLLKRQVGDDGHDGS